MKSSLSISNGFWISARELSNAKLRFLGIAKRELTSFQKNFYMPSKKQIANPSISE